MLWMMIVLLVISFSLYIIFPFFISIQLAMAILIGISCYLTQQTILGRGMGRDTIYNGMLRSRITYVCISYYHKFKSEAYPHCGSRLWREEF